MFFKPRRGKRLLSSAYTSHNRLKVGSLSLLSAALMSTAGAFAQPRATTERVSVSSNGAEVQQEIMGHSISPDGRYVAFVSDSPGLVAGDTNHKADVFVRDRGTGTTTRVSLSSPDSEANGDSYAPAVSADGRYVAFVSYADNLVAGDTNNKDDVFVRDVQRSDTERVSVSSWGDQGNGSNFAPVISPDGRYVGFESESSTLVKGDSNRAHDTFLRDRFAGTTERVSVSSSGRQGNEDSLSPTISADGRYVAFPSAAKNLVKNDHNGKVDIFVRDRQTGTTERVSVGGSGDEANHNSFMPAISADGRYVAYHSWASNLVADDHNGFADVFVRDRFDNTSRRISVDVDGRDSNGPSYSPAISADGHQIAFESSAKDLVAEDRNNEDDVFVWSRTDSGSKIERVSVSTTGAEANAGSSCSSLSISADGRFVAFGSGANNLVPDDTNQVSDVFVRDRAVS